MKRIICTSFVLAMMLCVLAVAVFATSYEATFIVVFDEEYITPVPDVNTGPVTMRYNPKNLLFGARAATEVSVTTDSTGRTFTQINGDNGEVATADNNVIEGNKISSGKAIIPNARYATKTRHFANRRVNGVLDSWDYWCKTVV